MKTILAIAAAGFVAGVLGYVIWPGPKGTVTLDEESIKITKPTG